MRKSTKQSSIDEMRHDRRDRHLTRQQSASHEGCLVVLLIARGGAGIAAETCNGCQDDVLAEVASS